MDEHLELLRREFDAREGTFLLGLRGAGLMWDKAAFSRLEKAMRWACEHFQDDGQLDRWMAEGFYDNPACLNRRKQVSELSAWRRRDQRG